MIRAFLTMLVVSLISGCGKTEKTEKTEKIATRYGVIVSQTGPNAEYGMRVLRGIQLAKEDFEKKHPFLPIDLHIEDSNSQAKTGLTVFQKLTDIDKVNVVFANASFLVKALGPAADEKKILLIGLGTTAPHIIEGTQYAIRHFPNADITTKLVASYAAGRYKKVAIGSLEDEYGKGATASFEAAYTAAGGTISQHISFPQGEGAFRTIAEKIVQNKPDAVFVPAYGPAFLALLKALHEKAPNLPILADINVANASVLKSAGDYAEGMIVPAFDLDAGITTTADQESFRKNYLSRFNEAPDMFVFTSYDIASVIFEMATGKSIAPLDLKNQIISGGERSGLSGQFNYDSHGDMDAKMKLFVIKGGKLMPVVK